MRRTLFVALVIWTPVALSAQSEGRTKKQQEKIQAKQEKEKAKAAEQAEKELRKRHLEIQDKPTRKRLKQHDHRADKHGSGTHRDPFLKRLFTRKH